MRRVAAVVGLVAALAVGACGSSDEGGAEKGAASVDVKVILDKTGIASLANQEVERGVELAFEQANEQKVLGDTKIEYTIDDAGSQVRQAVNLVSKATKQDHAAILFGTQSAESLSVAPIAQRAGVPMVLVASGAADPNELGDYIFRATAPSMAIAPVQSRYLADQGVKTVAIVDAADSPAFKTLAHETYPALAEQDGYEIVSTTDVTQADTEFNSIVSNIMDQRPDAVIALLTGAQYLPFLTSLERAGYDGIVGAQSGVGGEVLKPLGERAKGVIWPADYAVDRAGSPSTKAFQKAFEAKHGRLPTGYEAEGYDAAWFIVEGLKRAEGYSGEEVRDGLTAAAAEGIDTATGRLTFEGRDARTEGVLLTWDGKGEAVVEGPGGGQ